MAALMQATQNFQGGSMDPLEVFGGQQSAPDTPPPPPARIRPYVLETDQKVTRYLIGASVMEPSSIANKASLWTVQGMAVWFLISELLITFLGGWPYSIRSLLKGNFAFYMDEGYTFKDELNGWLTVVPLLLSPSIILLAIFEFKHRFKFEADMQRVIGEEDMTNITHYYGVQDLEKLSSISGGAKSQSTPLNSVAGVSSDDDGGRRGFWVLEYDGRIIGAVGLDGKKPLRALTSVTDLSKTQAETVPDGPKSPESVTGAGAEAISTATDSPYSLRNRSNKAKATLPTPSISITPSSPIIPTGQAVPTPHSENVLSQNGYKPGSVVHLRRFATSMSFRSADIEDDLLKFVANFAFEDAKSSLEGGPSKRASADSLVVPCRPNLQTSFVKRLTALGFRLVEKGHPLNCSTYDNYKPDSVSGILHKIWPVDIGERSYVLEKKVWLTGRGK